MPDVVGLPLDEAKSDIERAGFGDEVEVLGGGLFGVLDDRNWQVCDQLPNAGEAIAAQPRLEVERECTPGDDEEGSQPGPTTSVTQSPQTSSAPAVMVTDTTVDELLNRLNSADMGGIQVGDRFRFTGELFMSEFWGVGVTGDYYVLFKALGGAQDLTVFVPIDTVIDGYDGQVLEMVVENVERTIDGETTDGWLEAVSVG